MNARIRISVALIAALILGATSVTMAVARGQTRIGDRVVLCAGGSVTAVEIGPDGAPLGPVHICPDMALGLFAALALAEPQVPAARVRVTSLARPRTSTALSRPVITGHARGPPPSSD